MTFQATASGDASFVLGHDLPAGADNLKFAEVAAGTIAWILVEFQATPAMVRQYHLHPWCNRESGRGCERRRRLVTPLDVLILINRLNAAGGGDCPFRRRTPTPRRRTGTSMATTALTASDALVVITFINSHSAVGSRHRRGKPSRMLTLCRRQSYRNRHPPTVRRTAPSVWSVEQPSPTCRTDDGRRPEQVPGNVRSWRGRVLRT